MRTDDFQAYSEPTDLCQALGIRDTEEMDAALDRLDRYYKATDPEDIDEAKDFIFSELDAGADNTTVLALMVYFRRAISSGFWASRLPKNWRDFPKYRNSIEQIWIDWLDYIYNFIKSGFSTPPSFGLDPDKISTTPLKSLVNQWKSYAFREFGRQLIWQDSGKKDINDPGTTNFSSFDNDDDENGGGFEGSKYAASIDDDVASLSSVEGFVKELRTEHNQSVPITKAKMTACTPYEFFKELMKETLEYMSALTQGANGESVVAKKPSVKSMADAMGVTEPDIFFCKEEVTNLAADYDISSEEMVKYANGHTI